LMRYVNDVVFAMVCACDDGRFLMANAAALLRVEMRLVQPDE
jgi:hypothetical protein